MRRPFSLVCDEYQNYTSETILSIIKETRKVGLEVGLATQDVRGQPIDEALRTTIRKVAGNVICFGVDYDDARTLVKDLFVPDLDQAKEVRVRYQKVPGLFGEYTERLEEPIYRSLEEIWEREIRRIISLPDRHFWWKRRGEVHTHKVETPYVADAKDLAPPDALRAALARQDAAAFELAGVRKLRRLPWPQSGEPDGYDPFGW